MSDIMNDEITLVYVNYYRLSFHMKPHEIRTNV